MIAITGYGFRVRDLSLLVLDRTGKALLGGRGTIRTHRPILMVEVHAGYYHKHLLDLNHNVPEVIGTNGGSKYLLARPREES